MLGPRYRKQWVNRQWNRRLLSIEQSHSNSSQSKQIFYHKGIFENVFFKTQSLLSSDTLPIQPGHRQQYRHRYYSAFSQQPLQDTPPHTSNRTADFQNPSNPKTALGRLVPFLRSSDK